MISHRDRRAYVLYCLGAARALEAEPSEHRRHGLWLGLAYRFVGEHGVDRLSRLVGRLEREIGES